MKTWNQNKRLLKMSRSTFNSVNCTKEMYSLIIYIWHFEKCTELTSLPFLFPGFVVAITDLLSDQVQIKHKYWREYVTLATCVISCIFGLSMVTEVSLSWFVIQFFDALPFYASPLSASRLSAPILTLPFYVFMLPFIVWSTNSLLLITLLFLHSHLLCAPFSASFVIQINALP